MQIARSAPLVDPTKQIDDLKARGLFRQLLETESAQGRRVVIEGKSLLNFCSNDYLGLANNPLLLESFRLGAEKHGVGSGASPLVCGRSSAHRTLEEAVAKLTGRDRALIFSSGYLANLAIIGAFAPARGDQVFQDKLNHASMIDGALLSRARLHRYSHADPESLRAALVGPSSGNKLVLTESVFSMDGDIAPLLEIADLSTKEKTCLAVDDAHGFGVFGESGAGVLEALSLDQEQVPITMATFGKAIGCAGAFVAGPKDLIELMVQKSRPYIYSTALAPALAVAATKALQLLNEEGWRREHLFALIERFRSGAEQEGLDLMNSLSAIQPLLTGSAERALAMSKALYDAGIFITAIRPPTVPVNTSRLRITLSASHTADDVDFLLEKLSLAASTTRTKYTHE
jgi:8-amino-7-oxononanoate synthase